MAIKKDTNYRQLFQLQHQELGLLVGVGRPPTRLVFGLVDKDVVGMKVGGVAGPRVDGVVELVIQLGVVGAPPGRDGHGLDVEFGIRLFFHRGREGGCRLLYTLG